MTILAAILLGIVLALFYSRRGLFLAAIALISVFLAAMTALSFAAIVTHMIGYESQYAYSTVMAIMAVVSFLVIRGALFFIDNDVDFHPLVERAGGAVTGLATGLLIVGFAAVCLVCMPVPQMMGPLESSARQAADFMLVPAQTTSRIIGGQQQFDVDHLRAAGGEKFSSHMPPPPPTEQPDPQTVDS